MLTQEQYAHIKKIELFAKKHVVGPLLGDYRSALLGSGFEFHQLREYSQGDDIRFIDWKASARSGTTLIRQYKEDRNRMVYIVVDISGSTTYGSGLQTKQTLMKELAAILAFVAYYSKDAVGVILFSNEVEITIPPAVSRAHLLRAISTIYNHAAQHTTTNISVVLERLARLKGRSAVVCLISDFMSTFDQGLLKAVSLRHDLIAFRCLDPRETDFPAVGVLAMEDVETNQIEEIAVSQGLNTALREWNTKIKEQFYAAGVDYFDCQTDKQYIPSLVRFLSKRMVR